MIAVLTVTLNPALDLATHVEAVKPGQKLRCAAPLLDAGGGGINVSRALAALGGSSRALVALGGAAGAQVAALARSEAVDLVTMPGPGDTRLSLAVTEDHSGKQFRFLLPGTLWDADQIDQAFENILKNVTPGGILVLSGSQPPGFPPSFPRRVAAALHGETRLMMDTSGPALAELARSATPGLEVLRMDSDEAEGLASRPLPRREDSAAFAAALVARGVARTVIIARGADGSVLADGEGRLFAPAAKVPVKSRVGAGDSFVAGYVLALAQGLRRDCALAQGVAAASAAVMTEATDLCRREDFDRLLPLCSAQVI